MNNNAKFAFYYLLSLVALIFMSLSVGMIVFAIIDKSIIDTLINFQQRTSGQLRFAISALIISTPIFYFISHLINKGLSRGELKSDSALRRWLTYFILFISSLIVLGVLISVINSFLSGGLSTRFVLKAVSTFLIAAFVFSFYLYDIQRQNFSESDKKIKIFFGVSLALVLIVFSASWFFVESPTVIRNRRLDRNLLDNIHNLEGSINEYYNRYGELPVNLKVLENSSAVNLSPRILVDPANGQAIVYQKTSSSNFKLCATFRLAHNSQNTKTGYYPSLDEYHRAGYQCLLGHLYPGSRDPKSNNLSPANNNLNLKTPHQVSSSTKAQGSLKNIPSRPSGSSEVQPSFPRPAGAHPSDYYIN